MKTTVVIILSILALFFLRSCKTGYVNSFGDWTWVTIDESHGKRKHYIQGIDNTTFKVLSKKSFAMDNYQVYYNGKVINHATPSGFVVLGNNNYGYAKDNKYAFFNNEVIIGADPSTFEVLEFPYSKDKNDVYCGTLPMKLSPEEVKTFKVTNEDKLMKGTLSTMKLNHFLEYNPDYAWLASTNPKITTVITGEWGTGETISANYVGFKREK